MKYFLLNRITKEKLDSLNEDNLMFITNPGRMGDENGSTFIMKEDNTLIAYRASGWMYGSEDCDVGLDDMENAFPHWMNAWKNSSNEDYDEKFKYVYMGFGNGLCVNRELYDVFKKYLDEEVNERAKKENADANEHSLKYVSWEKAALKTANELGYEIQAIER